MFTLKELKEKLLTKIEERKAELEREKLEMKRMEEEIFKRMTDEVNKSN